MPHCNYCGKRISITEEDGDYTARCACGEASVSAYIGRVRGGNCDHVEDAISSLKRSAVSTLESAIVAECFRPCEYRVSVDGVALDHTNWQRVLDDAYNAGFDAVTFGEPDNLTDAQQAQVEHSLAEGMRDRRARRARVDEIVAKVMGVVL